MKLRTTMTLAVAARYVQAPRATLVYHVNTGELPALPLGRTLLFHRPHLDKFIKDSAEKRAAAIRLERANAPAARSTPAAAPVGASTQPRARRKHAPERRAAQGGAAGADVGADATVVQPELPGLEPAVRPVREPR